MQFQDRVIFPNTLSYLLTFLPSYLITLCCRALQATWLVLIEPLRQICCRLPRNPQSMDASEHIHRPCKKIRLEGTFESRNISISNFQHDEPSQSPDHSGYAQEPPRLNFEEARNINSFVSTCETKIHHRLVEYQSTQCAELNHQRSGTSRSVTSCSPSALCTPAGAPLENSEFPTKIYPDQVCFGMVGPHSAAQYSRNVLIVF